MPFSGQALDIEQQLQSSFTGISSTWVQRFPKPELPGSEMVSLDPELQPKQYKAQAGTCWHCDCSEEPNFRSWRSSSDCLGCAGTGGQPLGVGGYCRGRKTCLGRGLVCSALCHLRVQPAGTNACDRPNRDGGIRTNPWQYLLACACSGRNC